LTIHGTGLKQWLLALLIIVRVEEQFGSHCFLCCPLLFFDGIREVDLSPNRCAVELHFSEAHSNVAPGIYLCAAPASPFTLFWDGLKMGYNLAQ